MRLIANVDGTVNHFVALTLGMQQSDEVLVASPFLSEELGPILDEFPLEGLTRFVLVTTLKPRTRDQLGKLDALISFIETVESRAPQIRWEIRLDNKLHGKVYLFKSNGSFDGGIVTSANFTTTGLSKNHEFGIEVRDGQILAELEKRILDACEATVDVDDVLRMLVKVDRFRAEHPTVERDEIDLDLRETLRERDKEIPSGEHQIWLKPEGVTGSPVPVDQVYSESRYSFHFSKRRPSGVKIGDRIIGYTVEHGRLVGVFRVASEPERVSDKQIATEAWKERWPWYIEVVNETPRVGGSWYQDGLLLSAMLEKFQDSNPDAPVTAVGGKTLGALNYGHDKLRLSEEFGTFLIEELFSREEDGFA